jgi:hypothetical protein
MAKVSWISWCTQKKLTMTQSSVIVVILVIMISAWFGFPLLLTEAFGRRVVSDGARLLASGEGVIAQLNKDSKDVPPGYVALTASHQRELSLRMGSTTNFFKTRVRAERQLDQRETLVLRGTSGSSEWVIAIIPDDVIGLCIDGEWRTTRTHDRQLYETMRDTVARALPSAR